MKKTIIIIGLLIMLFNCVGCSIKYSDNSKTIFDNKMRYDEWVSPDGVHYWVDGYKMAPRYDNNGNLVIDKLENK